MDAPRLSTVAGAGHTMHAVTLHTVTLHAVTLHAVTLDVPLRGPRIGHCAACACSQCVWQSKSRPSAAVVGSLGPLLELPFDIIRGPHALTSYVLSSEVTVFILFRLFG
jgi:hypothetical protein